MWNIKYDNRLVYGHWTYAHTMRQRAYGQLRRRVYFVCVMLLICLLCGMGFFHNEYKMNGKQVVPRGSEYISLKQNKREDFIRNI